MMSIPINRLSDTKQHQHGEVKWQLGLMPFPYVILVARSTYRTAFLTYSRYWQSSLYQTSPVWEIAMTSFHMRDRLHLLSNLKKLGSWSIHGAFAR